MPKELVIREFSLRAVVPGRFDIAYPQCRRKHSSKEHIRMGVLVGCPFAYTRQGQPAAITNMNDYTKGGRKNHTAVAARHTATLGVSREKTSGKTEESEDGI